MKLLDALIRRTPEPDLPNQASDADLLAWADQLKQRPKRTRPLVAAPLPER